MDEDGAIDYIVSKLSSYNYQESGSSASALVEIGRPSVMPYKMIVILGKIGHDAKPAEATLKKLIAENSNADIRYAIEAALQVIR